MIHIWLSLILYTNKYFSQNISPSLNARGQKLKCYYVITGELYIIICQYIHLSPELSTHIIHTKVSTLAGHDRSPRPVAEAIQTTINYPPGSSSVDRFSIFFGCLFGGLSCSRGCSSPVQLSLPTGQPLGLARAPLPGDWPTEASSNTSTSNHSTLLH